MIHLPSANDINISFDQAGPLSPVKPCPLSIDLSDFPISMTPQTPSSLSIYDSTSNKGDDDKPCGLELLKISSFKTSETCSSDGSPLDRGLTLGEIISKRSYTKRPKEEKKVNKTKEVKKEIINGKRRRKQTKSEYELEEVIVKKEKHENGGLKEKSMNTMNVSSVSEIVFRDGKATLIQPGVSQNEEKMDSKLEIVTENKKKFTTSTSFKQMNHTEKWTEKETGKFYRALELFGTDFSMIAKVFKNRNRNQIKNKFLREEKIAPEKVNGTFKKPKPANFHILFKKFEKHKRTQKKKHSVKSEETIEKSQTIATNLLIPTQNIQRPSSIQEITQPEIIQTARNERSGSFYSTASIDSMDLAIMEDLADILMPQKALLGI